MSTANSKRWIWAILLAVLFPLFAVHFSCVAIMGPGTWGSGLEEKLPEISPAASNSRLGPYLEEFAGQAHATSPDVQIPPQAGSLRGRAVFSDHIEPEGLWVVQVHVGERWVDDQRIVLWHSGASEYERVAIPEGMIVENPVFIRRGGRVILVFTRWQSWFLPMAGKVGRFWRSVFDKPLRPEYSLYLYDLDAQRSTYWGPGHTLVVSPDGKRGLLLRSGAMAGGYYSLHVWDFETDELETVVSLRESDPGSVRSFEYRWSEDSRAFQLSGRTGGFERRKPEGRDLNLIYLIGDPKLYKVSDGGA